MWNKFTNTWAPVWEAPTEDTPASAISEAPEPAAVSAVTAAEGEAPAAPEMDTETTAPPESPAPVTMDALEVPEGITLSEEAVSPFLALMNNAELSRAELAQKLISLQIGAAQKAAEAADTTAQTLWNDTQEQWQREMRALPEIGGEALDRTVSDIKKGLIDAGATTETFNALDLTGAGNNPEIVKILHALTKNRMEGGPVSGAPAAGKLSQAERLFGGHIQE